MKTNFVSVSGVSDREQLSNIARVYKKEDYSPPYSRDSRNTPSRGNPRTRPIYRSPTGPEVIVEKRVTGEDGKVKVRILSPPYKE